MTSFENLFKNFFDTKEISDDSLKKFTEDHLQRLIANNGGGTFTGILTNTTNGYISYFGKMSDEDIASAVQQSLTMTVDNIMESFKDTVSQKEGTIRGFYNTNTPSYQEFFPHGVSEYRQSSKANVETLMNRMIAASTAHVADLGAPFVTLFTGFKTNYLAARNAQLLKIGEVGTDKSDTRTLRNALETQLCANLHFIGFTYPGDVDQCMIFFKQDIIRYDVNSATDGKGRITGVINDGTTHLPILDAIVQVIGVSIPVVHTAVDGRFKTQRMDTGVRQVLIKAAGKPDKTVAVTVIDDGDTTLNVDM